MSWYQNPIAQPSLRYENPLAGVGTAIQDYAKMALTAQHAEDDKALNAQRLANAKMEGGILALKNDRASAENKAAIDPNGNDIPTLKSIEQQNAQTAETNARTGLVLEQKKGVAFDNYLKETYGNQEAKGKINVLISQANENNSNAALSNARTKTENEVRPWEVKKAKKTVENIEANTEDIKMRPYIMKLNNPLLGAK